jgi:hypothetical protein
MAEMANSAIECPNYLIPTFFEHGLGYPLNVWEFEKGWFDTTA